MFTNFPDFFSLSFFTFIIHGREVNKFGHMGWMEWSGQNNLNSSQCCYKTTSTSKILTWCIWSQVKYGNAPMILKITTANLIKSHPIQTCCFVDSFLELETIYLRLLVCLIIQIIQYMRYQLQIYWQQVQWFRIYVR